MNEAGGGEVETTGKIGLHLFHDQSHYVLPIVCAGAGRIGLMTIDLLVTDLGGMTLDRAAGSRTLEAQDNTEGGTISATHMMMMPEKGEGEGKAATMAMTRLHSCMGSHFGQGTAICLLLLPLLRAVLLLRQLIVLSPQVLRIGGFSPPLLLPNLNVHLMPRWMMTMIRSVGLLRQSSGVWLQSWRR